MAFDSFPFSGQPLDENRFELMQGPLSEDGWWADPGGPGGQGYADTSGTTSKRRAGGVTIRGMYGQDTAERAFDHPANPGSNPRIDRVVARRDMAANKIDDLLIVGTPATNPTAPPLTQNVGGVWDVHNYQVLIPANFRVPGGGNVQAVSQSMVRDERRFQGTRLLRFTDATQLPTSGVRLWQEAVTANGTKYRWNGSAWEIAFIPSTYYPAVELTAGQPYRAVPIAVDHWQVMYLPGGIVSVDGVFTITENQGGGQMVYFGGGFPVPAGPPGTIVGDIWNSAGGRYTLVKRSDLVPVFADLNGVLIPSMGFGAGQVISVRATYKVA